MIASESKRKIIAEALENSQRQMKTLAKSIQLRAAQDEFKMENKFKNLENPLEFLRNPKTQYMINEAEDLSHKLQSEMSETSEFSKNIYKQVLSNEDYIGFFKVKSENQIIEEEEQNDDMEHILNMQRKLIEERKKNKDKEHEHPNEILKKTIAEKSRARNLIKAKTLKSYRHALQRDKENINQNFSRDREIKFQHIKDLNTPKFDNEYKHIEFYNMLKSNQKENYMVGRQEFNINNNEEINKAEQKLKFPLIRDSWEFGKESKLLFFFDITSKLAFWNDNEKQELIYMNKSATPGSNEKKHSDEQILRNLVDFQTDRINLKNILDYGMKIITPELLLSYFKLKAYHNEMMQRENRDVGLDDKYNQMMKKYEDIRQKTAKDKTRKIPTRIIDTQTQTINNYQESNTHKFFQRFELVEDILYKIKKLNKLRESAMKNYKKKSNLVILKNICLQIDDLLFKLIMLMLKGQNFFLKEDSQLRNSVPIFTCSDILKAENKQQVERKILELIYGNIDKFEVEKVDKIPKKTMITIYVEEREKNNKIYDILATKI